MHQIILRLISTIRNYSINLYELNFPRPIPSVRSLSPNANVIRQIMSYVSDANIQKLFRAAERNDLKRVKFCIQTEEIPATVTNGGQETLAHVAAKNGYFDMLVYVVEKAPSVLQKVDTEAYSVLHLAIEGGHLKMVKYLVENHKLDIHAQSKRGWGTALHTAVEFDRLEILKYFVDERNADINVRGKLQDLPPVFLAVLYQYRDIIDYLVEEKKADLTIIDSNGESILYYLVRKNDLTFVKRLLDENEMNFDVNRQNYLGETLVHVAVSLNRVKALEYLVDVKRANVNLPKKRDGMTPLHCAALDNRYEICEYLVERGANTTLKDASKEVARQKANDTRLIEYLEKVGQARSRRSVNSPYPSLRWFRCIHQKTVGADLNRLGRAHFNNYSTYIYSFLVLIQLIVARVSHRTEQPAVVVSPPIILRERMDTLAVDSILNIPASLEEYPEGVDS